MSRPENWRGSVQAPRVPQLGQATVDEVDVVGVVEALLLRDLLLQVVGAVALVARLALGQRVAEGVDVAAGLPDLARQDDARVEADHVVTHGDHGLPPLALDVLLELDAERAVVPGRLGAAVDLTARVDEAPALGERDDVVDGGRGRLGHDGAPAGHGRLAAGQGKRASVQPNDRGDPILRVVPGSTRS